MKGKINRTHKGASKRIKLSRAGKNKAGKKARLQRTKVGANHNFAIQSSNRTGRQKGSLSVTNKGYIKKFNRLVN